MSSATTMPTVSDDTFETTIAPGTGLVAVAFSAAWCAPCHVMTPVLEAVAHEYGSRVRVLYLDTDINPVTMTRFSVRGLPTLLVFRDGELATRMVGTASKAAVRERLDRLAGG